MDYEIEERDEPIQTVLTIQATCKASEIGPTLGRLFSEIGKYARENGAAQSGPLFCRYLAMTEDTWTLEGGCPIAASIPASDQVQVGQIGGHVAVTLHTGPYDKLCEAHDALCAWATAHGKTRAGAPWESYITDPGELPDPQTWQTLVYLPIEFSRAGRVVVK